MLKKLLELELWPGSLWAAVSDESSKYAVEQPGELLHIWLSYVIRWIDGFSAGIDVSLSPTLLMADAVKRSTVAHLFHFYPVLLEIVSIPRKTPSAWVVPTKASSSVGPLTNGNNKSGSDAQRNVDAMELDARTLARNCLKEVGKEMGVSR